MKFLKFGLDAEAMKRHSIKIAEEVSFNIMKSVI